MNTKNGKGTTVKYGVFALVSLMLPFVIWGHSLDTDSLIWRIIYFVLFFIFIDGFIYENKKNEQNVSNIVKYGTFIVASVIVSLLIWYGQVDLETMFIRIGLFLFLLIGIDNITKDLQSAT